MRLTLGSPIKQSSGTLPACRLCFRLCFRLHQTVFREQIHSFLHRRVESSHGMWESWISSRPSTFISGPAGSGVRYRKCMLSIGKYYTKYVISRTHPLRLIKASLLSPLSPYLGYSPKETSQGSHFLHPNSFLTLPTLLCFCFW